MRKIAIAKRVTTWLVFIGTAKIIHALVDNNTDPDGVVDKVTVGVGSLALAGLVADVTRQYTDAKIESLIGTVDTALHADEV